LPVTIGISLLRILEQPNAIGFKEPTVSFSNGTFSLSAPFYINNTGYYDLSDINVTILIGRNNTTLAAFSSPLLNVPAGTTLNSSYDLSFDIEKIVSKSTELLTDDTTLNLSISTFFEIAYVMSLGVSTNMTTSWGAPFYNLTVSEVSWNFSTQEFTVVLSFENHACFTVNGTILLEMCNSRSELIGLIETCLDVPSDSLFHDVLKLTVDRSKMTDNGIIHIYFENVQILEEWFSSE